MKPTSFSAILSTLLIGTSVYAAASRSNSADQKILFDTDSALFNDDGAALTMLLQSPLKNSIQGISLVAGNQWPLQGAEYMANVEKILGRTDIPLFLGTNQPLKNS